MPEPVDTPIRHVAHLFLMVTTSHVQPFNVAQRFAATMLLWLRVFVTSSRMERGFQDVHSGFGAPRLKSLFSQFFTYARTAFFWNLSPERKLLDSADLWRIEAKTNIYSKYGQRLIDHFRVSFSPFRFEPQNDLPFPTDNCICRKKLLLTKGSKQESLLLKTATLQSSLLKIRNTNAPSGIFFSDEFGASCRAFRQRL